MTIQFDAFSEDAGGAVGGDPTMTHAVGSGKNRLLVVGTAVRRDPAQAAPTISGATLGSESMTLLDSQSIADTNVYGGLYMWVHYLIGPPQGDGTITVDGTWAAGANAVSIGVSYAGVDQSSPIGTHVKSMTAAGTGASTSVTSSTNGLVIDFFSMLYGGETEITAASDQITRAEIATGTGGAEVVIGASEKLGAPSVTMAWTATQTNTGYPEGIIAIPLNPAAALVQRAISYFYDIYDPRGRILDDFGNEVPPWKLKANRWIKVTGIFSPSSKRYSTFVQDPEIAYIEEVEYSLGGGLRIKTSRGELTEVLLARAAGGKTL